MYDEEALFTLLRSIVKNMRKVLDKEIAEFGISHAEMRILMFLFSSGKMRQEELTSRIEVDRSNVGRSLKKLEQLGCVEREKDPEDTRSYWVSLTDKGRILEKPLKTIKNRLERTIGMGVSGSELTTLIQLLKKVDTSMSEENYRQLKNSE